MITTELQGPVFFMFFLIVTFIPDPVPIRGGGVLPRIKLSIMEDDEDLMDILAYAIPLIRRELN